MRESTSIDLKCAQAQELFFELKVRDVMSDNMVVMHPDDMMSKLCGALRKSCIPGVPVVEDDRLVGFLCIEDLGKWLSRNLPDCPVRQQMDTDLDFVTPDLLLAHAASRLDTLGCDASMVVDDADMTLLGVVNKGLIFEGMFKRLAKEMREEEVREMRASHFFEDITAGGSEIILRYDIAGGDFAEAGKASTTAKRNLKRLGIPDDMIHRLAIASYEAEINTVIYTEGGSMEYRIMPSEIALTVADHGPGIEDIDLVMQEGYSTAPDWVRELGFGAGMGIPNIKKNADDLVFESEVGVGTRLVITVRERKNDDG